MIFLTSNVGARESSTAIGYNPDQVQKSEGAARRLFSPEFRNRLTAQLTYQGLSESQLRAVADLELRRSAGRILHPRGITLGFDHAAIECVLEPSRDRAFGA